MNYGYISVIPFVFVHVNHLSRNHLSFVLKQKKEAKKNSRLTFFSYSLPSLR
ncbi:hypothetical protein [Bacteroides xylanisolvens]|uniref:hypothetical protein n=1 Tax=Bacteroides xylanisolvens TaxID=371601 RepID=UPI0039B6A8D7